MKTKALFAGSFDPLTNGHLNILTRAAGIFDEVVVGVVVNLEKKPLFTYEERVAMIEKVTEDFPNISVDKCTGLLADFVNKNNFNVVVRGLRSSADFALEQQMSQLHSHLYNKGTETVFLIADAEVAYISSTMAKQVISLGGDGSGLVPEEVLRKMKEKYNL